MRWQDGIKEQISVMSMFQSFELYGLIAADNIWHGRSTANVNSVRGKLGDEGFKLWWGGFAGEIQYRPDLPLIASIRSCGLRIYGWDS